MPSGRSSGNGKPSRKVFGAPGGGSNRADDAEPRHTPVDDVRPDDLVSSRRDFLKVGGIAAAGLDPKPTDLSDGGLEAVVERARSNAVHSTPDDAVALAVPEASETVDGLVDPEQGSVSPERKVAFAIELETTEHPWGCDHYVEHGRMMPEDGLKILEPFRPASGGVRASSQLLVQQVSPAKNAESPMMPRS